MKFIKVILVGVIYIVFVSTGKAQSPLPQIVFDPQAVQQAIETANNIQRLEDIQRQLEQAKRTLGFVADLQSVGRMINLIESTVCTLRDFDFNYQSFTEGMITQQQSCLFETRVRINMNKVNLAADLLNMLLDAGVSMAQHKRMELMNDVTDNFEDANMKIGGLNMWMQRISRFNAALKTAQRGSERDILNASMAIYTINR